MSVKIKIKITKDILKESACCSYLGGKGPTGRSCAFALAVRDIFPNAYVETSRIIPFYEGMQYPFTGEIGFPISREMSKFILNFDCSFPEQRVEFPEQEFELEIPDWVIEKIDIQDIINSKTLEIIPNETIQMAERETAGY